MLRAVILAGLFTCLCTSQVLAIDPIEIKDGERVVLLGNTLIERDQVYGYFETLLTSQWPDRNFTVRNLGWSGDTVWGDARAGFGTATEGFAKLKELVLANRPTTLIISYGTNESFAGEQGLKEFQKGLDRLLDTVGESKARIILVSPIKQEKLAPPLPDPTKHNDQLIQYTQVLQSTAATRHFPFIDLTNALRLPGSAKPGDHLTTDGLQLSEYGYWQLAHTLEEQLQLPSSHTALSGWRRYAPNGLEEQIQLPSSHTPWQITITAEAKAENVHGTKVEGVERLPDQRGYKFTATDERLPECLHPQEPTGIRILQVQGLADGNYTLQIDGHAVKAHDGRVVIASAKQWAAGCSLLGGPQFEQVEKLRTVINAKNKLYFYRWRPQNETYLFGFRKHEQGKNAAEVVQFDPLIAEQEAEIAKLRVPVPHQYALVRETTDAK